MSWSINFRGLPFIEEMIPSLLKHMNSVLSTFMLRPIIPFYYIITHHLSLCNPLPTVAILGSLHGIMAKFLDLPDPSEFEFLLHCYFRPNTLVKGMNLFIPTSTTPGLL